MKAQEYEQHIPRRNIARLRLVFDPVLSYCYISYFHIVNQYTIEWIQSSHDGDTEFVYFEPEIDKTANNLISKYLLGREMVYVKQLKEQNVEDFLRSTTGLLCMLEDDFVQDPGLDELMSHTGAMSHMLYALFTRQENEKFTSHENEFRILYKIPTIIDKNGLYHAITPRILKVLINGNKYDGKTVFIRHPCGVETIDAYLHTDSPMLVNNETSLLAEVNKGYDFSISPEFIDVNMKKCAIDYGYIGNKDDCIRFVESRLKQGL